MTELQGFAIKQIAGRLAWNKVWQYQDQTSGTVVFVVEAGQGRTISHWHFSKLVEGIEDILGPETAFIVQGVEETPPDAWLAMQPL